MQRYIRHTDCNRWYYLYMVATNRTISHNRCHGDRQPNKHYDLYCNWRYRRLQQYSNRNSNRRGSADSECRARYNYMSGFINHNDRNRGNYLHMVAINRTVCNHRRYSNSQPGHNYYLHHCWDSRGVQRHCHKNGYHRRRVNHKCRRRYKHMQRYINNNYSHRGHYLHMVAIGRAVCNNRRYGSGKPCHYNYLYYYRNYRGMLRLND
jgi:hypothetical protein